MAFETLLNRHVDALYSYALRLGHSTTLADDLVQETWLKLWEKAHTFKPGKVRTSTWLHRILHNKFIDKGRKHTELLNNEAALSVHATTTPQSEYSASSTVDELNRTLAKLPQNQRAALLLTHAQGFSNKEVATILGVGTRAVESLLARARLTLRNYFQCSREFE